MEYYYQKENNLNLALIHQAVYDSLMVNKQIQYCTWNEETKILACRFLEELSHEDKIIFDNIIAGL